MPYNFWPIYLYMYVYSCCTRTIIYKSFAREREWHGQSMRERKKEREENGLFRHGGEGRREGEGGKECVLRQSSVTVELARAQVLYYISRWGRWPVFAWRVARRWQRDKTYNYIASQLLQIKDKNKQFSLHTVQEKKKNIHEINLTCSQMKLFFFFNH